MKRYAPALVIGLAAVAAWLLPDPPVAQPVTLRDAAGLRGGQGVINNQPPACASTVITTTNDCYCRAATGSDGNQYMCNGHIWDRECQAATTNNGTICKSFKSVCTGSQLVLQNGEWAWSSETCSQSTYSTPTTTSFDDQGRPVTCTVPQ